MSALQVQSPCWWSSSCQEGGHGDGVNLTLEAWQGLQSWGQALLRCYMILGTPSLATGAHEGCCKPVVNLQACEGL